MRDSVNGADLASELGMENRAMRYVLSGVTVPVFPKRGGSYAPGFAVRPGAKPAHAAAERNL